MLVVGFDDPSTADRQKPLWRRSRRQALGRAALQVGGRQRPSEYGLQSTGQSPSYYSGDLATRRRRASIAVTAVSTVLVRKIAVACATNQSGISCTGKHEGRDTLALCLLLEGSGNEDYAGRGVRGLKRNTNGPWAPVVKDTCRGWAGRPQLHWRCWNQFSQHRFLGLRQGHYRTVFGKGPAGNILLRHSIRPSASPKNWLQQICHFAKLSTRALLGAMEKPGDRRTSPVLAEPFSRHRRTQKLQAGRNDACRNR